MALNLKSPPVQHRPPEFHDTGPAPAPPPPHVAPRMGPLPAPNAVRGKVRRVTEPELTELQEWVPLSLQDRWPRLEPDRFVFWMRQMIFDRMGLLIRTDAAIGAFVATTFVLEPWPTVSELFVRNRSRDSEDWLLIYQYAWDWSASISARECRFGFDTDAKIGDIRKEAAEAGLDLGRQRNYFVSPVKEIP